MTNFTWRGGTGSWQTPGNWSPNGGPPGSGDTAGFYSAGVADVTGSGSAAAVFTYVGTVTFDGSFTFGTLYNLSNVVLDAFVSTEFIETEGSVTIDGTVNALSNATSYDGVYQYDGTVEIGLLGSLQASEYLLSYGGGSYSQLLIAGGSLAVIGTASIDPFTGYANGGLGLGARAFVEVYNGGSLDTPYLSLEDPNAVVVIDGAAATVTQTSADPQGLAGIQLDAGTLAVQDGGTLTSTYIGEQEAGAATLSTSLFLVDASTLDVTSDADTINGIFISDGLAEFQNGAEVTTSQLFVGPTGNPNDTNYPNLIISASTVEVTGTDYVSGLSVGGVEFAYGAVQILEDSTFYVAGALTIDSPAATSSDEVLTTVTLDGGSTMSVVGDIFLGASAGAYAGIEVSGSSATGATQLVYDGGLAVGYGGAGVLNIEAGGTVVVADTEEATGAVFLGFYAGADGLVIVNGEDALFDTTNVAIGEGGAGDLLLSEGGSLHVSQDLFIGDQAGSVGTLELADNDGSGAAGVAGTLYVGNVGDGLVTFTGADGTYSGDLFVTGDAVFGVQDGALGAAFADGGTFEVGGSLIVGDGGGAAVGLSSVDLTVVGDLIVGNANLSSEPAELVLQDVAPTIGGELIVGEAGSGTLSWSATEALTALLGTVAVGDLEAGDGTFDLSGDGNLLGIEKLYVGNAGTGALHVYDGATLAVTDNTFIGSEAGADGTIYVDSGVDEGSDTPNAGGAIEFLGSLTVGADGVGALFVGSEGEAIADTGTVGVAGDLIIGDAADAYGLVVVASNTIDAAGTELPALLQVDQDIVVGETATGTVDGGTLIPGALMQIDDGGEVDAVAKDYGTLTIGNQPGSSGEVDINNGTLSVNQLYVGNEGDGVLFVEGGGTVDVADQLVVADSIDSTGTIELTGQDTELDSHALMVIGGSAQAIVNGPSIDYPAGVDVKDGATLSNDGTGENGGIIIGYDPHSLGSLTVDGADLLANSLIVGADGSGVLTFSNDSTGTFYDDVILGLTASGFGGIDVDASTLEFYGALDIGEAATGSIISSQTIPGGALFIENDSTVVDQGSDGIDIGVGSLSTGVVLVDASLLVLGTLTIGDAGHGLMTVQNGGSVELDPDSQPELGLGAGSTGTLVVSDADFIYGNGLVVGDAGAGTLIVQDTGSLAPGKAAEDAAIEAGSDTTGTGQILVTEGTLEGKSLTIGNAGSGTLTITDGGTVAIDGDVDLASETGSTARVSLTGGGVADTVLNVTGGLTVGNLGSATLVLGLGATIAVGGEMDIGGTSDVVGSHGIGTVIATDMDTVLQTDDALVIGAEGQGTLIVSVGAGLKAKGDITIGDGINAKGALILTQSTIEATGGAITLGNQGTATLTLNGGAVLDAGSVDLTIGATDLGRGTFKLGAAGAGGAASAETGDAVIGQQGNGTVSVLAGSTLTTDGDAIIGDTGAGNVTVSGTNATTSLPSSLWLVTGGLTIGGTISAGGGLGTLSVANGGTVQVAGTLLMWSGGTIIDNSASLGLIEIGGTTLAGDTGLVIDAEGSLSGAGTIMSAVEDDGGITAQNGRLIITGSVTGAGSLEIAPGATLDLLDPTPTVDFLAGGPSTFEFGGTSATIADFVVNDVIQLDHFTASSTVFSNGTFELTGLDTASGQSEQIDLVFPADQSAATLSYTQSNDTTFVATSYAACYVRGTRILSARGEVAIERLSIGDLVRTQSGALRPIRWIGRRRYAGRFAARNKAVLPVLIRAGALEDGVPHRDLLVSPLHAMYLDEVLVPALELVNGVGIVQLSAVEEVEYFHIELETHDIVLAEGAPSESFVDDDSRGMFHNAAEYAALYPNARRVAARYCAPRVTAGYALTAIRRRLAIRAGIAAECGAETLHGFVDHVDGERVEGWAQNPARPEAPVCLDIVVDGAIVAQTLANVCRGDLAEAGFGSGRHAFSVRMPYRLTPQQARTMQVRRSSDRQALPRSKAS